MFCVSISLGPDEMEILLHFMYGAILDFPPGTNVRYTCSVVTFPLIQCDKNPMALVRFCRNVKMCVFVSDLSQVVLAADMLGLEGLKDVAEMVLTRDYCRFFPKVRTRGRGHDLHIQSI